MFNQHNRSTQELEDALLEQRVNQWLNDEELAALEGNAYNSDASDLDLEAYSDRVAEGLPKENLRGLVILAAGLAAGILLVGLYWYLHFYKGIL